MFSIPVKTGILALLLFLVAFTAGAQHPRLRHLSVNDGLSSNTVYDIYADHEGYLWFGTDKGIARYDGTRFEYFTTSDGLPDNVVFSFKEDRSQRLWISTNGNVLCYYYKGIFHTPENTPFLKLPFKSIQSDIAVAEDSSVTIFFSLADCFVSIRGNRVLRYDLKQYTTPPAGRPVKVVRLPRKGYKILYPGYWLEIDDAGTHATRYSVNRRYKPVFDRTQDRQMLYASNALYDTDEKKLKHFTSRLDQYSGFLVACLGERHTFLCTGNGVFVDDPDLHLLAAHHITAMTRDMEGHYWLAAVDEGGAYCIHKGLSDIEEAPAAYAGKVVHAGIMPGGLFFITDVGHLYCFNKGRITRVHSNSQTGGKAKKGWFLVPVVSGDPGYFIFYGKKNYWIHGATRVSEVLSKSPVVKSKSMIKQVTTDSNHIYYILRDGLSVQPLTEPMFSAAQKKKEWVANTGSIASFAFDEKRNLWLSTDRGLRKLEGRTLSERVPVKSVFRKFGFYNHYLAGYTDRNQLLLIRGYDTPHPQVDTVDADNSIWTGIYPVDSTHLILSSNNNYRLLHFRQGPHNDYDLQIIENKFIPARAEFIAADSEYCYFFGENAITTVKKKVLFERLKAPGILFTGLKTTRRQLAVEPVITVSYNEARNINIGFDYLSYNASEVRCQYRIVSGHSGDWKSTETDRNINLVNPGYGTYEISLRVNTASSDFSPVRHFTLIVERPYWARWWFLTLCIAGTLLLLSLVFFIVFKWLLNKRQQKFNAEMKLQRSEFKALHALMNPHFVFNSLNNIQNLIIKKDIDQANRYLIIFSRLIRQNMHNIDREYISLDKEIQLIEHYLQLEQLRFKEQLHYEIKLELPAAEIEDVLIPALLLQPLVENAIKHGIQPGSSISHVTLKVFEEDDTLVIEICDNGAGLTASAKRREASGHESFAVNNIRRRVAYFNSFNTRKISFELLEIRRGETVKGAMARLTITGS